MTWPLAAVCVAFLVLVAWVADRVFKLHDARVRDSDKRSKEINEILGMVARANGLAVATNARIDEVAKTAADAAHKATQVREQLTNAVVARTLR